MSSSMPTPNWTEPGTSCNKPKSDSIKTESTEREWNGEKKGREKEEREREREGGGRKTSE